MGISLLNTGITPLHGIEQEKHYLDYASVTYIYFVAKKMLYFLSLLLVLTPIQSYCSVEFDVIFGMAEAYCDKESGKK